MVPPALPARGPHTRPRSLGPSCLLFTLSLQVLGGGWSFSPPPLPKHSFCFLKFCVFFRAQWKRFLLQEALPDSQTRARPLWLPHASCSRQLRIRCIRVIAGLLSLCPPHRQDRICCAPRGIPDSWRVVSEVFGFHLQMEGRKEEGRERGRKEERKGLGPVQRETGSRRGCAVS